MNYLPGINRNNMPKTPEIPDYLRKAHNTKLLSFIGSSQLLSYLRFKEVRDFEQLMEKTVNNRAFDFADRVF